jgi:hypothetical protein
MSKCNTQFLHAQRQLTLDEDIAGGTWHHYPFQRGAGFDGDYPVPTGLDDVGCNGG